MTATDDLVLANDDAADRYLVCCKGFLSFVQSKAHKAFVIRRIRSIRMFLTEFCQFVGVLLKMVTDDDDVTSGVRMPPPTMRVTEVTARTALIISGETGWMAPEPASK